MNWRRLRNYLTNLHQDRPQEVALIDRAVRMAEEALADLARIGHTFHLAEGLRPVNPEKHPDREYPRMMYHLVAAPRGHLVLCEEDREWLGEGWFDTLAEAQHADGMGYQFRRGGIIPKRGLPVIVSESEPTRLDKERANGFG